MPISLERNRVARLGDDRAIDRHGAALDRVAGARAARIEAARDEKLVQPDAVIALSGCGHGLHWRRTGRKASVPEVRRWQVRLSCARWRAPGLPTVHPAAQVARLSMSVVPMTTSSLTITMTRLGVEGEAAADVADLGGDDRHDRLFELAVVARLGRRRPRERNDRQPRKPALSSRQILPAWGGRLAGQR